MQLEQFFTYTQQDILLMFIPAILCAIYRAIFIAVYHPYSSLKGKGLVLRQSFSYGFWWGLDINAYVILVSWSCITVPSLLISDLPTDILKSILITFYGLTIYFAFVGKMIFYKHFNDIYNYMVHYGKHAEKNNLLDVFFNQYNGAIALLGAIPVSVMTWYMTLIIWNIPTIPLPSINSFWGTVGGYTSIVIGTVACFYWFRFGGTFLHRNKPEWDMMPIEVKEDIFFAKATVDDLIALKKVFKEPLHEELLATDEEMVKKITHIIPKEYKKTWTDLRDPLMAFHRTAQGAKIQKPPHIFFIVGESITQWSLDNAYKGLQIAEGLRSFAEHKNTIRIHDFLPAGNVSRPSISSLISGIYDGGLELNEREAFWSNPLLTSMPEQMKRLGYQTIYWYGGNASNGNFNKYSIGQGFDKVENAWIFCGETAPRTWVGVYDHIFLEETAKRIERITEPTFHFVYTTTNHGPYTLEDDILNFNASTMMDSHIGNDIKNNKRRAKELGTYHYCDKALFTFVEKMKESHPNSLFIVTGDHSALFGDLKHTSLVHRDYSNREKYCTVGLIQHPQLSQDLVNNRIGSHMHLFPTIIEAIAPKGFQYYSIEPSLFEDYDPLIVTPYQWMTDTMLGHVREDYGELNRDILEPIQPIRPIRPINNYRYISCGWKMLAAWIMKKRKI